MSDDERILFAPPSPRKESTLIFAGDKVGKSSSWLDIAQYVTGDFYVIDTDNTFWASITDFPDLESQLDRFHIYEPYDWNDYRSMGAEIVREAGPDDFLIVDRVEMAREAAVDYHIEEIYGQGAAQWRTETLRKKQEDKKKGSINTEIPWSLVNSTYYSFLNHIHRRGKGHKIFCAGADKIVTEGMFADDSKMQAFYSLVGYKPAGGSKIGYIPHTLLYMAKRKDGVRLLSTIGDRGRKNKFLNAAEMDEDTGFFFTYMVPVAGWRPK